MESPVLKRTMSTMKTEYDVFYPIEHGRRGGGRGTGERKKREESRANRIRHRIDSDFGAFACIALYAASSFLLIPFNERLLCVSFS